MKQPARVVKWVEKMKAQGHIIKFTPNGHPYAELRTGARRSPKNKNKLH